MVSLSSIVFISACLPSPSPVQGPIGGEAVGVIGDSQTYIAEEGPGLEYPDPDQFLTDLLVADGRRVSISAFIGAGTHDLSDLEPWPEPLDILAIALGANDMRVDEATGLPQVSLAEASDSMTSYLQAAGFGCLVLVGIPETTPWGLDQTGPAWNSFLQSSAAGRGGVFVDWNAQTASNPGFLTADGIHQTPTGQAAFREAIRAGVNQCASLLA
jgi:lysophospholipase L1-like esterase